MSDASDSAVAAYSRFDLKDQIILQTQGLHLAIAIEKQF
jgi:hypothetical protein